MRDALHFWRGGPNRAGGQGPDALGALLEENEPIVCKFAQFLALKPDLISAECLIPLLTVADRAPAATGEQFAAMLQKTLGSGWRLGFSRIDPTPFASRYASQTHAACLTDGREVLIKVAREKTPETIRQELVASRGVMHVIHICCGSDRSKTKKLIQDASSWILDELDLGRELASLRTLRRTMTRGGAELFPHFYSHLSNGRVLTVERLNGVLLLDVLAQASTPKESVLTSTERLGQNLANCLLKRVFRCGLYNKSVHPDQVIVLTDGRISYHHFSLNEELDEAERKKQLNLLSAIYDGDLISASRQVIQNVIANEQDDLEGFRRRWLSAARDYINVVDPRLAEAQDHRNSRTAQWLKALLLETSASPMWLPSRVTALYRHLISLEAVMLQLKHDDPPSDVIRELLAGEWDLESLRLLQPTKLRKSLFELTTLIRDSPGNIQELLSQLAEGTFRLKTHVIEARHVVRARYKSAKLITTAILCVCLSVLLTIPNTAQPYGASLSLLFNVLLFGLFVSVYLQWKNLR